MQKEDQMEISSKYQPEIVEQKWYDFWLENKINHADPTSQKSFTIVIPPPNITGALHMGHALNNTLQDVFIRLAKKRGYNACWIPGTDHGGIATQNVIEKQLKAQKINKEDIGRDKFLEIMWDWRRKTGDTILTQLRKLGCLCDWDKTRFTMDKTCAKAVFEAFKRFFDEGLIYRGNYIVNWCPRCHTALSDIEVEHEDRNGELYYLKYPISGENEKFVIVATTRPETMLGDTAVAVNPDDERFKNLIGETVLLPLANREIKIIADQMVDKEFGTGAVKITPSHDPNDYETGIKHKLQFISVIDKNGKMNKNAGIYDGLDRYEARKRILQDLEAQGFVEKIEKYSNKVSVCYRCETVIEPLVSLQWYLDVKDLAREAINVVQNKSVKFLPETWEKPYLNWMENLRDWCISRQIWWGHRIPIWYCDSCYVEGEKEGLIVSDKKPDVCPNCGNKTNFTQDTDVLDTWFSSALWPFSTMGWPEKNANLDYFYPTKILATGHEILYLWVARMIMMGVKFMDEIPFETVYIHGIVRDSHGQKMSKSKGNVIDPLEIIEKFGTDALRFSLIYNGIMGRDLQISEENFTMSRNFCNKLWNASRLVLMNLSELQKTNKFTIENLDLKNLDSPEKWILSNLEKTKFEVAKFYEKSDFAMVAKIMYEFVWNKYCDWYLELSKTKLYSENLDDKKNVLAVLVFVLREILNLLNPIIPFITEEINENLSSVLLEKNKNLATANFSNFDEKFIDEKAESEIQNIIEIITAVRNIKAEMNLQNAKNLEVFINYKNDENVLSEEKIQRIKKLTKCEAVSQAKNLEKPKKCAFGVTNIYEIYVPLEGLVDFAKEKERLEKELQNLASDFEKCNKKLENQNFVEKAPKEEVDRIREKQRLISDKIEKIKQNAVFN